MGKTEVARVEDFVKDNKVGVGIAVVAFIFIIVVPIIILIVYHFWFGSGSSSSPAADKDETLTSEEETKLFTKIAKKMIGTTRYFQLHPISNKYLDSASSNTVWDITSGFGTAPNKGNCFKSDNNKYALYIDENSYILLLKDTGYSSAGLWEISKVLYDAESSNTYEEPFSLCIDKQGDPGNFTSSSKTNFVIKGSTPAVTIKTPPSLLTFGTTSASNYRLYIDESAGKLRVRVYGSSFTDYVSTNDIEVSNF